jgi:hypothetical protein
VKRTTTCIFDEAGNYLDPNDPSTLIFFTTDDNTETDAAHGIHRHLRPWGLPDRDREGERRPARRFKYRQQQPR